MLKYLRSRENGAFPQPELILLDVNIPIMDGWEFIEAYLQFNKEGQDETVVIMLTTSLTPEDKEKANRIPEVKGLISKPLNDTALQDIQDSYFVGHRL